MSTATFLAGLQQEVVYGSNWLGAPQTVSGCADFQSLYESESCCSSSSALSKQFVLFERPSSLCEVGWRSVTLGGVERCLKLHGTAVWTKAEANAACATEGGELVMPKTASDDAEVLSIINGLDSAQTSWLYFWIGAQQGADATAGAEGWVWDDGSAVTTFGWASGQPTNFPGATDDGPEDCLLYRKSAMAAVSGWYDFGCSPSARVVCMVPYIAFMNACWGVSTSQGWDDATGVETGGQAVCLKILDDTAYNIDLARAACGGVNSQLYYPSNRAESDAFATHVYSQLGDAKVWINIEQDFPVVPPTPASPGENWRMPTGVEYAPAEIPWATSDPEQVEPTFYPGQNYINMLITATGGTWQDLTRMTTGSGALCVKDAV